MLLAFVWGGAWGWELSAEIQTGRLRSFYVIRYWTVLFYCVSACNAGWRLLCESIIWASGNECNFRPSCNVLFHTHTHTHLALAHCLRLLMLIFLNKTAWDTDKFNSSYMHDQGHSWNNSKWRAWRKAMNRIWIRVSSVQIVHRTSNSVQFWVHVQVQCICKPVPVCRCVISSRRL